MEIHGKIIPKVASLETSKIHTEAQSEMETPQLTIFNIKFNWISTHQIKPVSIHLLHVELTTYPCCSGIVFVVLCKARSKPFFAEHVFLPHVEATIRFLAIQVQNKQVILSTIDREQISTVGVSSTLCIFTME